MSQDHWLDNVPPFLKRRFSGLGSYIEDVLRQENLAASLNREQVQAIHLAIFVEITVEFFKDGSRAAADAVSMFESVGIQSFALGNTEFRRNNSAVKRGDRLAGRLSEVVGSAEDAIGASSEFFPARQRLRRTIIQMARSMIDE